MRLIDADAFMKDNEEALQNAIDKTKERIATDEQAYAVRGYAMGVRSLLENLSYAPAIEAEPVRHGRWEETDNPSVVMCSECNICEPCDFIEFEYCPNCGAKMDGDCLMEE